MRMADRPCLFFRQKKEGEKEAAEQAAAFGVPSSFRECPECCGKRTLSQKTNVPHIVSTVPLLATP
jgi:hypothetical protein